MKSVLRWCVVPLLAGTLVAQTAAKPRAKKAAAKSAQPAVTLQDLQSLKDALAAQQQQIEQLRQEVQQKHQPWHQAHQHFPQPHTTPQTHETLTNFFDRKTIELDRGYIPYNPIAHKWLSLTGGKFAYTWQRTPVTFDSDLNPEGFNQKLSWDLKTPFVKNFTIQGIELLYNEVSEVQESYALGGQVSAKLVFWPCTATPSFLSMKWNRPDAILAASAFAVQATTTGAGGTTPAGPFPTPGEGPGCTVVNGSSKFAPCIFAPNGMTNAVTLDDTG